VVTVNNIVIEGMQSPIWLGNRARKHRDDAPLNHLRGKCAI
jgi:hypothetical protein